MKISIDINNDCESDKIFDELITGYKTIIIDLVKICKKNNIYSESIKEICLTTNYIDKVKEITKNLCSNNHVYSGRTQVSVSKIIFNHDHMNPKHIIILDILHIPLKDFLYVCYYNLAEVYYSTNIPKNLKVVTKINSLTLYDDIINFIFLDVIKAFNTSRHISLTNLRLVNIMDNTIDEFMIKIKDIHIRYQKDNDLDQFWMDIVANLAHFLTLFIKQHFLGEPLSEFNEFELPLKNILIDLYISSYKADNNYDHSSFKKNINSILELLFIKIDEVDLYNKKLKHGVHITITENPKLLFNKKIIHTQESIVAFIDILGFSDFINEYDSNPNSDILQKLKKTLEQSLNVIYQSKLVNEFYKEVLDYRLFSDCLCISIPIFENNDDILSELYTIFILISSFQYLMLLNGFLLRGGVAIGSYYSDPTMIFSGGLVKAYHIEAYKANNPIVMIDEGITRIIRSKTNNDLSDILSRILLVDYNNDNITFINPMIPLNLMYDLTAHNFNSIFQDEDSYFLFKKLFDQISKQMMNLKQSFSEKYLKNEIHKSIRLFTELNLVKFNQNNKVKSKYLWLKDFIDWFENKNNKFGHFNF